MARPSPAQLRARRLFVQRFGHKRRNPRAHRRRKLRRLRAFVLDRGPWAPAFYSTRGGTGRRGRRRIARAMPRHLRTTVIPAYVRRRARSNPGGGGTLLWIGLGALALWAWSRSSSTASSGGPNGIMYAGPPYSAPPGSQWRRGSVECFAAPCPPGPWQLVPMQDAVAWM